VIKKSDLVCPWLLSTLVSDDGGRVTAFADYCGERCPYWGITGVVRGADGKPQPAVGCRRVKGVLRNE